MFQQISLALQALKKNVQSKYSLVYQKFSLFYYSIIYSNGQRNHLISSNYFHLVNPKQSFCPRYKTFLKRSFPKVSTKNFSTVTWSFHDQMSDPESKLAYNILCSLPAYKTTTINSSSIYKKFDQSRFYIPLNLPWESIDNNKLVFNFLFISKELSTSHSSLRNEQYHQLCQVLLEKIYFLNEEELQVVLLAMLFWMPSYTDFTLKKFDKFWNRMDLACLKKLKKWDRSIAFLIADYWFAQKRPNTSQFLTKFLDEVGIHVLQLTPTQFVQYLYYISLNNNFGIIKRLHLHKKILEVLSLITIEELGIMAFALSKVNRSLDHFELLDNIIEKTLNNLVEITDFSLASILKLIRNCLSYNKRSKCYNFLEDLNDYLDKFNDFVHLQAGLLASKFLVFHHGLLCQVSAKFMSEISVLPLIDIHLYTDILMTFQFIPRDCPNMLQSIVTELRKPARINEINAFPKCYVNCVNSLIALGIFPHDLISAALQPSMAHLIESYPLEYIGKEINILNWNLKIEVLPKYLGYFLQPHDHSKLTKQFLGRIPVKNSPHLMKEEKILLDVYEKISKILGIEDSVCFCILLPHFSTPGLVFCTTHSGEPVKVPAEFLQLPEDALKSAKVFESLGLMWNAIIYGGKKVINKEGFGGNFAMKKRQLTILGYNVSIVSRKYATVTTKRKLIYLEKLLQENSSLNLNATWFSPFKLPKG